MKILKKTNELKFNKNFILIALNLSFITYHHKYNLLNKDSILWPDGIMSKYYKSNKKIPGSKLISQLIIPQSIRKIVVLGNLPNRSKKFLKDKYGRKIINIKLPFDRIENIKKKLPKINKSYLYLITLPTPKQELIGKYLIKKNKNYKIICIGGGLDIASGHIKRTPKIFYNLGLESIWRLFSSDFFRRFKRLFYTLLSFIYLYLFKREKLNKLI